MDFITIGYKEFMNNILAILIITNSILNSNAIEEARLIEFWALPTNTDYYSTTVSTHA